MNRFVPYIVFFMMSPALPFSSWKTFANAQGERPENFTASDEVPMRSLQIVRQSRSITHQLRRNGLTPELVEQQKNLIQQLKELLEIASSGEDSSPSPTRQATSGRATTSQENEPSPTPPAQASVDSTRNDINRSATSTVNPSGDESANRKAEKSSHPPSTSQRFLEDAIWGHLPARERDPLIRSFNERSLPGYEQQVRDYFEALAKQKRNRDQQQN